MSSFANPQFLERLCALSRKAQVGLGEGIEWPERLAADESWFMSPELLSLHGLDAYERLSEPERRRLSFFEAVNFFSLNIHGEKYLLAGLAERLHTDELAESSEYLHHFVDEENKHLYYFSRFCRSYAGKIYAHPSVELPRERAPGEESFLFFATVLAFEEVVDVYNRAIANDDRVHPVARAINRLHHEDEVRHLAFGRVAVRDLFRAHAPRWPEGTTARVAGEIAAFMTGLWHQYHNPEVYEDAGLPDPYELADVAYEAPAALARRRRLSSRFTRSMVEIGVFSEEPAP